MADYARPLFRHKFSKTQAMADYELVQLTRTTRNWISQAFDVLDRGVASRISERGSCPPLVFLRISDRSIPAEEAMTFE
jgi:hypothetical protein